MSKFTKEFRREQLEKRKHDPNLSSAHFQTKELVADSPEVTNKKLQECVSLVVAKVRRAIRKDRANLEKELKLLKDAAAIYKSVRELDLKVLEIQLKSKQSQELAQIVLNLNQLPDEQLKQLAAEVLNAGHNSNSGTNSTRPPVHNELPPQELQRESTRTNNIEHDFLSSSSSTDNEDLGKSTDFDNL